MLNGRKPKTSKKGVKRPYRRAAKRTGKSSAKYITTICKKVISKAAENKAWFNYGTNIQISNTNLGTPVYLNLLPSLTQSVGKSGRVGNEIKVKSGFVRGHINILPYNVTTNPSPPPVYVKIWLVASKTVNTNLFQNTPASTSFFDVVNSSLGFQGNMLDIDWTINKDLFTLYASKTVKLGASFSHSTGPVSYNSYFDNSPMSVPFSFSFGKHVKTLKYDDTTTVPTNRNMFLVWQAVNADGSSPTGNVPAEYHYSIRVDYEDM